MSKGTVNKVILIGRLGNDPEIRTITSGAKVASLNLATNESYKKGDEWQESTEWHRLVLWRNKAELAEKYLKKGSRIFVEGRLQTRQWQDNNGNQRYTTEVVVNELQFLDGKGQSEGFEPAAQVSNDPLPDVPDVLDDSAPDDDIPF